MKKILLALSLLIAAPAFAATSYGSGAINDAFTATLVAVNDQICYNNTNLATKLATVQWTVVTAGSGGITVQISKDYGTNALAVVPYSVLTSTISVNPSTAPWVNNGPVVGTYETPLPHGATNFCILYQTGGTATTITFAPGKPYTPGSVTATLYDITSAVNTINTTGVIDYSGWASVTALFSSGGATTAPLNNVPVGGDGVNLVNGGFATVAAAAGGLISLGFNNPSAGANQTSTVGARGVLSVPAVAAQQTRLTVYARR